MINLAQINHTNNINTINFIHNNNNTKVLNSLLSSLNQLKNDKDNCSYFFSIAFITSSGITPLLEVLKTLDNMC